MSAAPANPADARKKFRLSMHIGVYWSAGVAARMSAKREQIFSSGVMLHEVRDASKCFRRWVNGTV